MRSASDPAQLYSAKGQTYLRFIGFFLYPQGIRAYFRASPLLRSGMRVLDAGCGTGVLTLALREALLGRELTPGPLQGFDLSQSMIERFRDALHSQEIEGVEVEQADVTGLGTLPDSWKGYDLIVSASMLEYVPPDRFVAALGGLRALLREEGTFLLFISRESWLMRLLVGRPWQATLYEAAQLTSSLRQAGFSRIEFRKFPIRFRHLALWGHIVEARI